MKGLFVTGTDTGVGKTEVARYVARLWRSRGLTVGACKPAETGVGEAGPSDAIALAEAAGDERAIHEICPFRFAEPLAPAVAAAREKQMIDPRRLVTAVEAAARGRDRVIAETAGGLLVPYADGFDGVDLIAATGLRALLVARLGLGTLNHTRLSVEALRAREIRIVAVVLSVGSAASAPPPGDIAAETNPAVLAKLLGGIPVVTFPFNPPQVPALDAVVE